MYIINDNFKKKKYTKSSNKKQKHKIIKSLKRGQIYFPSFNLRRKHRTNTLRKETYRGGEAEPEGVEGIEVAKGKEVALETEETEEAEEAGETGEAEGIEREEGEEVALDVEQVGIEALGKKETEEGIEGIEAKGTEGAEEKEKAEAAYNLAEKTESKRKDAKDAAYNLAKTEIQSIIEDINIVVKEHYGSGRLEYTGTGTRSLEEYIDDRSKKLLVGQKKSFKTLIKHEIHSFSKQVAQVQKEHIKTLTKTITKKKNY